MENLKYGKHSYMTHTLPGYIAYKPLHCQLYDLLDYSIVDWTPYERNEILPWFTTKTQCLYYQDKQSDIFKTSIYSYSKGNLCFYDNFDDVITYDLRDIEFDLMLPDL